MLARLSNLLGGSPKADHPSFVLLLGDLSKSAYLLHLVPEEGTTERFNIWQSKRAILCYGPGQEVSREELAMVFLHVADGETAAKFLHEVGSRAEKIFRERTSEKSTISNDTVTAASEALRSAAADSVRDREGRAPPQNAAQTYPIFLVQIQRSRPGKLVTEADLTSFPR